MKVFRPSQDFKSCASTIPPPRQIMFPPSFEDSIISAMLAVRPGGEVVTRRSAKALCAGSIPARASRLFTVIKKEINARETDASVFF